MSVGVRVWLVWIVLCRGLKKNRAGFSVENAEWFYEILPGPRRYFIIGNITVKRNNFNIGAGKTVGRTAWGEKEKRVISKRTAGGLLRGYEKKVSASRWFPKHLEGRTSPRALDGRARCARTTARYFPAETGWGGHAFCAREYRYIILVRVYTTAESLSQGPRRLCAALVDSRVRRNTGSYPRWQVGNEILRAETPSGRKSRFFYTFVRFRYISSVKMHS